MLLLTIKLFIKTIISFDLIVWIYLLSDSNIKGFLKFGRKWSL